MAPTEEVFLRLAGERGLLDPERQEQARRSADSTPPSEFAVRQGWITPHARDVLLAEAAGALAPAVPSVTRSVSRSGRALPDFPGYVILDELGHGGMGIVYQARQTALGRDVALKVLIAGEDATASTLARFEREARAAARLQHPNIVQVHDVGRRGAFHFFTMQLVVGRPLSKAIREGLISPRQALELTQKVALALDYAHAQGVIHRDVKPQNIILDWRGEPLLADFGLAKDVRSEELTALGESIGTPTYASPEQLGGETDRVGPRSDVYSLGATLYQLLTGQPPFVGDTLFSVIQQVLMEEPVPPRRIRANLHRDIETICLKAMEKEASRRYATAREFADDIGRYLEGEPILASTAGRFERSWRRVRRYPLVFGLAAAVLIASVTTGALWWKRVQDRTTAERERAELIRNAREREEAATRERDRLVSDALERLRVTGDALVEASLARRALGDLPGSRKYAEFLWPAVEELKERAPHLAEPWYHEGRMLRALQREEPAEQSQDEAVRLARRPDATAGGRALLASALYERGVLRMLRWLRRLAEKRTAILQARSAGRRPEDAPPETPTEQDVDASHPEVKDVKRLAAEDLDEVPRIAQAGVVLSTAAVALSSYLKGARNAEALLRLALKEDRYRVEVYDALASLAEARGDPEEAARIYEEGHQADRGYLPHLFNEAAQLRRAAAAHPERAIGLLGRAMEAADAALSLDPDSPAAWVSKSAMLIGQGDAWWASGAEGQAEAAYEAALHAAERALSLDPRCAEAAVNQASVHLSLGDAKAARGEDPSDEYQKALAGFDWVVSSLPRFAVAVHNQAKAHQSLGDAKRARGEDASDEYRKALAGYDNALSLEPRSEEAAIGQGNVHQSLGDAKRARAEDACDEYQKA
ncbi:MAG: protein kinase, partial [Planctomycetes bacterium]|nr:protein kinase [Planctomycetota bacterium]